MIKPASLTSIPAGSNPFHHDHFNMGTRVAKNVMIMHPTHDTELAGYIIVVNTLTGERLKVSLADDEDINMVGQIDRKVTTR